MDEKKWFLLIQDKVQGPYYASEVLKETFAGRSNEGRFWAKGRSHWMNLSQFQSELEKERSVIQLIQTVEPEWRLKDGGSELGPWSFAKLIEYLKTKPNYKKILVTSDPQKLWKEVYQVDIIMEKLGVNRRAHPRVPIDGLLTVHDGFLKGIQGSLTTLSQGGLGAQKVRGFSIGEKFKGSFSAKGISVPIHFQAEVVFLNPNGDLGLRFINLSTEALTHIIAYVKQFVQAHPEEDFHKIA